MSAPQRVDQTSFSTSSSMEEVTAELPILAFTFTGEVAADNHRFGFRVIDIGRDDGSPGSDFIADELGGNVVRQTGAKAFSGMLLAQHLAADTLAAHVFANGDEFHLRGDDHGGRSVVALRICRRRRV